MHWQDSVHVSSSVERFEGWLSKKLRAYVSIFRKNLGQYLHTLKMCHVEAFQQYYPELRVFHEETKRTPARE